MKRLLQLLFVAIIVPIAAQAKAWDDNEYKRIEQSIKAPTFPERDFVITKYGAKTGNTAAKNQKAINKAILACSKRGGGRVIVPAGTYLTGAITLLSNVNLVVEKDAKLQFVFEPDLYPVVPTRWEGLDCHNVSPCIYAYKQENIAVTGEGTIDGGGSKETWWQWTGVPYFGGAPDKLPNQRSGTRARLLKQAEDGVDMNERIFTKNDGLRPQLINFNQCENILLEDLTLLRSPFWVIHPLLSKNITVRGMKIINDGPNGDGCDPESCDGVLIENCYFNTGDDCIAIKSGRNRDGRLWDRPSENIIIRNCEMKNGHGGVVIGSEISGGCRNVYAENNVMDSPELERVVRIKTNTCRGGIIENINARNIKVGVCKESVLKINLDYEHNEICCRGYIPTVRNINIENITCEKSQYGVQIIALDTACYVYDINVKNCRFNGVRDGNSIKGMTRDVRFDNLFINGSLALQEKPFKNYSQWLTYSEMKRVPKSYLLDFSSKPKWSYVMGIELEAMLDTYLKYGGDDILAYCREYTDTMIAPNGAIRGFRMEDYNLDNIRTGHFVTRMYQLQPEKKNLLAMQLMMKQLKKQPRTIADKVYWHKAIYSYQVWLDGIFMGLPFYTLTARDLLKQKDAQKIYDDAVNQISVTYQRTFDPKTGLNRHAWDETHEMFWADKETGLSQHCWGRAQGWYTMALIELLDALPENYSRRGEVIELLRKDLDAVIKWQDKKTGVWYQVMDSPEREGNYLESTCSSMFAYALLKAYRKGYLGEKYRDAGIKAYKGIINNFIRVNADKTISLTQCCAVAGLGPGISAKVLKAAPKVKENKRRDGSFQYYLSEPVRDNDAKGVGPFIWASLEMEMLGFDTDNTTASINREAVLFRNNPIITKADNLASLTVGNGHFAATVDVTGLQSYTTDYEQGIPLTTMSDWGWHSFPNTEKLTPADTEKSYDLGHGHQEVYAVEYKQNGRNKQATEYFRVNPHRLNLGAIGLQLTDSQSNPIALNQLTDIHQELHLWDAQIDSHFLADGKPVDVITFCRPDRDQLVARVKSPLLKNQQAKVAIRLPYPTGKHADHAADWSKTDRHTSSIVKQDAQSALIQHQLDSTTYYIYVRWNGIADLQPMGIHQYALSTTDDVLEFSAEYSLNPIDRPASETFADHMKRNQKFWHRHWSAGAFADFGQCTDPRAKELERRVVLSQYLTYINCAGNMPPQETGLTYNSWFGRPHLEMTWWHAVDFCLWNQPDVVARMLRWYDDVAAPVARNIAKRQGFKGLRWMKMTDPWAGEAPSNVGSFLLWQQPHYIYLAEEMYRANPSDHTLKTYAEHVEQTAEFMADFAKACDRGGQYIPLTGATAMQECMRKDFSYNHPFELSYWRYGLTVAQKWRERMGKSRHADWDNIIKRLAPLPEKNGIYQAGLPSKEEPRFDEHCYSDHPAVLGSFGLIPTQGIDSIKMRHTFDAVMHNWHWETTWGWDYGMIAMTAARLGEPETALQTLLIDTQKNTYLPNGHNFQTPDRLRLYLPGNGSLLTAIAMMCCGWDGCQQPLNPGFPQNGKWNVRWEGFNRMQ